jgi:hypothetical protein
MYRRLTTYNLSLTEINEKTNKIKQSNDNNSLPKWITADVNEKEMLGNEDTTAQVHPGYTF